MEKIITEFSDRDLIVSVHAIPFVADWTLYGVDIISGDSKVRLGQYELMSLVRMIYRSYETIRREEDAEIEAVPAEV